MNQATPQETELVLEWFETAEGRKYLKERLDKERLDIDHELMNRYELRSVISELDSDQLYKSIQLKIRKENRSVVKKSDWFGYGFKVAAAVLVIVTASLLSVTTYNLPETVSERRPVHFQTEDEQHREITLTDGSVVRLNSNSNMVISEDFMKGARAVTLTGEAYFDVAHNPEQPFIIHTNESVIEVLGTSFNVRSLPDQDNVQVAVVDGKVSFANRADGLDQTSVVLSKGEYGFMDIKKRTIIVDDLAVENYLAWKTGRFVFEEHTLQEVCTQLYNRLYGLECSYADEEIRQMKLTANFSNDSLEKTLSVIALSLNIEYEHEEEHVKWVYEKES